MSRRRTRVGTSHGAFSRSTVHLLDDSFENDRAEGFDVVRTRVLFDEVLLITLHRSVPRALAWVSAISAAILLALSISLLLSDSRVAGLVLLSLALLPLAGLAIALLVQRDTITVCGPRSRLQLQVTYRKRHARELFERFGDLVAQARARAAPESEP